MPCAEASDQRAVAWLVMVQRQVVFGGSEEKPSGVRQGGQAARPAAETH